MGIVSEQTTTTDGRREPEVQAAALKTSPPKHPEQAPKPFAQNTKNLPGMLSPERPVTQAEVSGSSTGAPALGDSQSSIKKSTCISQLLLVY
jgi:hypothetical protein